MIPIVTINTILKHVWTCWNMSKLVQIQYDMNCYDSYTQYVLISKGPISKTSQISGFSKQWLVKFSKLSNNLFCSIFLSNPLVNFFKLSKSKWLLLHSNSLSSVFLSGYAQTFVSFFRFSLHCFNLKKFPEFHVFCLFTIFFF